MRWFGFGLVADLQGSEATPNRFILWREMNLRLMLVACGITLDLDGGNKTTTFYSELTFYSLLVDTAFYQHPLANAQTFLTLHPICAFEVTFQCNKH